MDQVSELLFLIGALILVGTIIGEVLKKVNIPAIVGYIIAGLIFGPTCFNLIPIEKQAIFSTIAQIALGFIAFNVGVELFYKKLKKLGITIFIIAFFESMVPVILISLVLMPFLEFKIALLLGVFAAATSPAPIGALMTQFRIKGRLIDTTLPITAIDDALGVIYFGIAISVVSSTSGSIGTAIFGALKEVGASFLIGAIAGAILALCINFFHKSNQDLENKDAIFLSFTVVAVLASVSLGTAAHASPILLALIMGTVFTNMVKKDVFKREHKIVNLFQTPFMVIFFGMAGLSFVPSAMNGLIIVALIYIVTRAVGKYIGSYFGSAICKAPASVKKNLGIALLPQGGVELGLAVIAMSVLPTEEGKTVQALVLIASIVFTLLGTIFAKKAFENAGELSPRTSDDK